MDAKIEEMLSEVERRAEALQGWPYAHRDLGELIGLLVECLRRLNNAQEDQK